MTSIPLTQEQVMEDWLVLNVENVGLTDEQFIELCCDNRDLCFELTAQKELIIMTPPGPKTGRKNAIISTDLEIWARENGGVTFAANTIFALPVGSKRGPDACWLSQQRWDALTEEEKEGLPTLWPEFAVELMSPSDRGPVRFRMVLAKMDEYMANGVQLAWLIDPFKKRVYVYRPNQPVECLENPTSVSADPVLPGFVFQISKIW